MYGEKCFNIPVTGIKVLALNACFRIAIRSETEKNQTIKYQPFERPIKLVKTYYCSQCVSIVNVRAKKLRDETQTIL